MRTDFLIYGLCILAIMIVVVIRVILKKESKSLDEEIHSLDTPGHINSYEKSKQIAEEENNQEFNDLETTLEQSFLNQIITAKDQDAFSDHYRKLFKKAYSFRKKLGIFHITPSNGLEKLINDYCSIPELVKRHNAKVIQQRLNDNKDFFDHCLDYPLDEQQRRSIVSEEDNCLVISSAGSGKTSSIVGKVKYLIDIKKVSSEKILLISYTNKAAQELTDRVGYQGIRGYTFHKLALDLIAKATGKKPSICSNTDALVINIYHQLLNNKNFKSSIVEYFIDYREDESERNNEKSNYKERIIKQKYDKYRALLPDMDGNIIYVRSKEEQKLCFILSSLGLSFRYEEPYEYSVSDEMHSQYRPDFSIHYEKNGIKHRIYLEHFAIDEHGLVPLWFAKDKGISYDEANQKYGDGITWKKELHKKFGTTLISTSSADFHYKKLQRELKEKLRKIGVPIQEKTEDELFDLILPEDSKQEKAFIRLIITFMTLMKSRCTTIDQVLKKVHVESSEYTINNIIKPVFECYESELKQRGEIDFTDAILMATDICKTSHCVSYSHIIVDEFQDISIDRYCFLVALREGTPQAKLYCVGDDWQSIYRFSGSDMALFNHFEDYFGPTEINRIETTYRFSEPLVSLSSQFIQRNKTQVHKHIRPFKNQNKTELIFYAYGTNSYSDLVEQLVSSIPSDKSIFLLGRYSFDDLYLAPMFKSETIGDKMFYFIGGRRIEFLTVHKSKGLEADYVIILQCNKGTYGFPSQISDNPVLDYVLTQSDQFPFGEERRLFYVAITRAKIKTMVLYDKKYPSVFVDEFLHPDKLNEDSYAKHPNAMKKWSRSADRFLITLYNEGKSIREISEKMGRSQTAIVMRLGKLGIK